jgi:LytS/YehU family sensor histidine kinase
MAEVFRYILSNKGKALVLLQEEIQFVKDYFSLLEIRFESAIQLKMDIESEWTDQYLIPPISLQILVENATKHNEFSQHNPLIIQIRLAENELIVSNETRKKSMRKPSSGIGLHNLNERYKLITEKSIFITENDSLFSVVLPVLKII